MPEYVDSLPDGPAHRRGAGINPGNRFEQNRFHLDGDFRDWLDAERDDDGRLRKVPLQVLADDTRRMINRVARASDMPFDWTLNPYRGCEHGCVYCYARPYHEFLGYSCGLDFETKIVAKHDAAELLQRELAHASWLPEPIVMSAITDVYQPIEAKLRLTRRCLEVMVEARQPVSTMTKGSLVLRDLDLWAELATFGAAAVTVTIVTLDDTLAKQLEPRAASPKQRLRMIRELSQAGVPVSVNVAPVIPGLTDSGVPELLEAVAEAGARQVRWVMLRLPYQLKEVFLDWLKRTVHEDRAKKVESKLRQLHGGRLYKASQRRGRGQGPLSESMSATFDVFTRRFGLNRDIRPLSGRHFRRPDVGGQMSLF